MWQIPGANGAADRDTEPTLPQQINLWDGWVSFDITPLVRQWVSGARPNYGFILHGGSGGGVNYTFIASPYPASHAWRRPKLTIT